MNQYGNLASFKQATSYKDLPFGGKALGILLALLLVVSMLPVGLAFPQNAEADEVNPQFEVQYYAMLEDFDSNQGNAISLSTLDLEKNKGLYTNDEAIYYGANDSRNTIPETELGYFYLNSTASSNNTYTVKKKETLTEIYRAETFSFYEAPNLSAFDIVSQANDNYQLEKILVKQPGDANWTEYTYSSSNNYIFTNNTSSTGSGSNIVIPIQETSTDKTTIRLQYSQKAGTERSNAQFFDYDVTDGKVYADYKYETELRYENGKYYKGNTEYTGKVYVKTIDDPATKTGSNSEQLKDELNMSRDSQMQGINSANNTVASGTAFYGFGNNNIATNIAYDKNSNGYYINQATAEGRYTAERDATGKTIDVKKTVFEFCSFGIVKAVGLTSNALPIFSDGITAPDLFNPEATITGKTNVNGWQLGFNRLGDSYTLTSVYNSSTANKPVLSGLNTFSKYSDDTYSNNFWPMDYSGTNELMFGNRNDNIPDLNFKYDYTGNGVMPSSDDGENHNAYFGMTYSVDFEIQENYAGPLEYIFFGDDDMWVYLTEYTGSEPTAAEYAKAKLVTDIGGVHSSVGSYVNLRDFLTDVNWEDGYDTHKYRLNFFYTERGASGSSCYMEFTLPGVTKSTPQEYGSLTIDKDSFYVVDNDTKQDIEGTYKFDLTLTDASNNALLNNYPWVLYSSETNEPVIKNGEVVRGIVGGGTTEFDLEIGTNQYITIDYLPLGSKYQTNFTVTEDSSGNFEVMSGLNGAEMTKDDSVSGSIGTNEGSVQNAVASFDNIYETSGLSIAKKVTGNAGSTTEEWDFEVSLTAPEGISLASSFPCTIDDTEGTLAITNGKGTVSLKHGETATITGLPVGTTYTVNETAHDGYESSAVFSDTAEVKTIAAGETDTVTFTNNKNYISVAKVWNDGENTFTGNEIDVKLIDTCHDTEGNEIAGDNSEATPAEEVVQLNSGNKWFHEWTNLSGIHTWTIEEVSVDGYNSVLREISANQGTNGLDTDGLQFQLTNTLITDELSISKEVDGNAGDFNKEWTFQIELTDPSHVTLADSFTYDVKNTEGEIVTNNAALNLTDGIGSLSLKHGQTAIISGLPIGTAYTVTETNADNHTAAVTSGSSEGVISSTADASVTFTNEHNTVAVTKNWENDGNTFIGESIQVELIDTCHDANGNEITEETPAEGTVINTATISPNDEGVWYYEWTNANTPELLGDHTWTVREVAVDGYTSSVSEVTANQGVAYEITNIIETGDLVVSKMVDGNAGDTNKAWEFTVTLKNSANVALKDAFTYEVSPIDAVESEIDTPVVDTPSTDTSTVEEGVTDNGATEGEDATEPSAFTRDAEGNVVFTVNLKHDEKVTLSDLPVGTEYIIDETEANKDGYITTINGMITLDGSSKGTISADETAKAEYQNTCDIIFPGGPKTGDTILPLAAFAGLALVSIIIALIARRNMRKN